MKSFLSLVLFSLALGQSPSNAVGCSTDSDCTGGFCQSGQCARYSQTGESCGGIMPPIGVCAPGLDCILPYNPNNPNVNLPGRCGRGCKTNTDCNSTTFCDTPTKNCIAYLQEGATCEDGALSTCANGLTCSHGKCTSFDSSSSSTYPQSSGYDSGTYNSPSSQSTASGVVSPSEGATGPAYPSSVTGSMSATGPLAGSSSGQTYSSSEQTGSLSTTGPLAGSSGSEESSTPSGPSYSSSAGQSYSSSAPTGPGQGSGAGSGHPSSPAGYPSSPAPGWASSAAGSGSPSSPTSWGGKGKHKPGCGGFVIGRGGGTGGQNGPDGAPSAGVNCANDSDCSGKGKFCDPMSKTCMTYRQLGENCGNAGTLTPIQCAPGLRCVAQHPMPGSPRVCANDLNVTCPQGSPAVSCFTDMCNISACEGYPNATCTPNYCGGCNTTWSIDGQAVQCKTKDCSGALPCPNIPTSCNSTMTPSGTCCPVCADCEKVFCPAIFCDKPVKIPGACCPVCPSKPDP